MLAMLPVVAALSVHALGDAPTLERFQGALVAELASPAVSSDDDLRGEKPAKPAPTLHQLQMKRKFLFIPPIVLTISGGVIAGLGMVLVFLLLGSGPSGFFESSGVLFGLIGSVFIAGVGFVVLAVGLIWFIGAGLRVAGLNDEIRLAEEEEKQLGLMRPRAPIRTGLLTLARF